MNIKSMTMYVVGDRYFNTMEEAIQAELEDNVSKLLRLNIEGVSLRDHDRWIKNVIKNKRELIKLLKEVK